MRFLILSILLLASCSATLQECKDACGNLGVKAFYPGKPMLSQACSCFQPGEARPK